MRRAAKAVAKRLRGFVRHISDGHSLPAHHFLVDAITGLITSGDVKLSEWGRALNEDVDLIYTEKRLSRWMGSDRIDDESLMESYRAKIGPKLRNHVIAVDGTDVIKPAAEKMPFLKQIRDGSTGGFGNGWNAISVEASAPDGRNAPLALRLFSHDEPRFKSEHAELAAVLAEVAPHVSSRCLWTFDRGYDNRRVFKLCDRIGLRWIIRLQTRHLSTGSEILSSTKVVRRMHLGHQFRRDNATGMSTTWSVGWAPVKVPHVWRKRFVAGKSDPQRHLVVVRGRGKRMALLTNQRVRNAQDAERIVCAYLQRWGVEESIRCWKQGFNTEDVRVLRWGALKRMMTLVALAYGFLALEQLERSPWCAAIITRVARGFGPTPRYAFYRLLEAYQRLFTERVLMAIHASKRGPPRCQHTVL